ncbi:hypothetical protein RN001_011750 [Aquatica leii]|uniref:Uncharacterized protein n=1 Tax=Aquatica leii TaxID=1421715 RepID=A0AAN7QE36_9COLE|nr:hypothetical protein RN001_011750 [Aquatica leii]
MMTTYIAAENLNIVREKNPEPGTAVESNEEAVCFSEIIPILGTSKSGNHGLQKNNKKKQHSQIFTSTPIKDILEEKEMNKGKRLQTKQLSVEKSKRKLYHNPGLSDANKENSHKRIKVQREKAKKVQYKEHQDDDFEGSDNKISEDICIICGEFGKNNEMWIRRTRKYVPPKYKPPKQRSKPVEPIDNWRLSMLALPTPFKTTPKYVFIPEPGCGSGVSPGTLTGSGTSRTNDLSVQTIRYLTQARLACQHLGGRVVKNLDKTIKQSWNTIYNYYARQLDEKRKKLHRILQEQNKGIKPKTPAEIQAEIDKRIADWTAVKALGKVVKLDVIRMRMDQMAEPTRITAKYIRPSIDPTYVDPLSVKPGAKKYVASERVVELSRNPAFKLIKLPEIIPGAVKRGALKGPSKWHSTTEKRKNIVPIKNLVLEHILSANGLPTSRYLEFLSDKNLVRHCSEKGIADTNEPHSSNGSEDDDDDDDDDGEKESEIQDIAQSLNEDQLSTQQENTQPETHQDNIPSKGDNMDKRDDRKNKHLPLRKSPRKNRKPLRN